MYSKKKEYVYAVIYVLSAMSLLFTLKHWWQGALLVTAVLSLAAAWKNHNKKKK